MIRVVQVDAMMADAKIFHTGLYGPFMLYNAKNTFNISLLHFFEIRYIPVSIHFINEIDVE